MAELNAHRKADADADGWTARRIASRRVVLAGALAIGALPVLAACGGDDSEPSGSGGVEGSDPTSEAGGPTSEGGDSGGGGDSAGGGGAEPTVVAAKADVPEGSGIILADEELVVTQPSAGQFRGFSSICTHQQCPLDNVTDGTINCICHGSMFSIEDGSVIGGPAPSPLPEKPIIVSGQEILLAPE